MALLFLFLGYSFIYADSGFVRGSGFNEGDLNMQKYSIQSHEVDSTPISPPTDEVKLYACDDAGTTKMCTIDSLGATTILGSGGAVEGTAVLSTGETGGAKYLREDGDGTCSWQTPAGSGDLLANGTVPLTADWNAGNSLYDIIAVEFKGALIGNSSTATALAANGANCAAGNSPLGVDASGAVESCFDVWTEAENTAAGYTSTPDQVGTLTNGDMCTNDGSAVQCTVNTEAEFETAMDGVNFLVDTEIDASSELLAIMDDETGSASGAPLLVFNQAPAIDGNIKNTPHHWSIAVKNGSDAITTPYIIPITITDAAITVTNLEARTSSASYEIAGDLKWADARIGLANAAVIETFDTTSGVRTDAAIASGSVGSGKFVYLVFDAAPNALDTDDLILITWDYD